MPKNGTKTLIAWTRANGLPEPLGHKPARDVILEHPTDRLFGVYRHPVDWYRSWYAHCRRAVEGNKRTSDALRAYGRGSIEWRDVLYGLTHPVEVRPHASWLPYRDHLFNPAGDQLSAVDSGLWSRSVRWFFQAGTDSLWDVVHGPWLVDRLIPLERLAEGLAEVYELESVDLPHVNAGDLTGLEIDDEMREWVMEADGAMWEEVVTTWG